jgi:hypothetical protein
MDRYDDDINRRSRWLKIGGGALAGVVLLAAGFGVGRLSAPVAGSGGQQHASVSGQSGPGPTRVENGVPVGYAHTPEGAVAAATNYLTVVDGQLITQPDKYRAAIDALAAPASQPSLRRNAEKDMKVLQDGVGLLSYAQQGRQVIFRAMPLAYHVDRYDGRESQVSIWAEGFIGVDGALSVRESWTTSSVTVSWTGTDWKLVSIAPPTAASQGPAPMTGQPQVQTADLPTQLKTYRSYQHVVGP